MVEINNIFLLMNEKGLTAKDLSEQTGISPGNISDWKSGRSAPKAEALVKIANFFNVSIDYLLGYNIEVKELRTARENAKKLYKNQSEMPIQYIEEKTQTNYATFRLWLSGYGDYFNDKLYLLADLFGVSVDYLLGRDEKKSDVILDEAMTLYLQLDELDKAEIKGTIKQMLKDKKYTSRTIRVSEYAELAAEGGSETRGRKRKKVEMTE